MGCRLVVGEGIEEQGNFDKVQGSLLCSALRKGWGLLLPPQGGLGFFLGLQRNPRG